MNKNDKVKNEKSEDAQTQKQSDSTVEIEALKKKIEEGENKYKRALADYQNLEKRISAEKREWILTSNKNLLLRILPILDTLMLASKHSQDQSLKVSVDQFLDVLKQEGITRIETKDKDFDPRLMQGIERVEGAKDKVIEETRAGYMIQDNVLIPAEVRVGNGVASSN